MMNRDTPAASAKAVKNPSSNSLIKLSAWVMVWNIGPKENATFVKMLYTIDGNCKTGYFARNRLTAQMLKTSHIAQTADCDEL